MKKYFLALLLFVGCDDNQSALKQTRNNPQFTMQIVEVPSDKITDTCSKLGVQYEANGCAAYYPNENLCTIYIMPQRFAQDTERLTIIGHELWHCRYGEWHD